MESVQFNYPAILVAAHRQLRRRRGLVLALALRQGLDGARPASNDATLKRAKLGKVFALAFVCSLVMAFNLAGLCRREGDARLSASSPASPPPRLGRDVARHHLPVRAAIAETLAHQRRLPARDLHAHGRRDRRMEMIETRRSARALLAVALALGTVRTGRREATQVSASGFSSPCATSSRRRRRALYAALGEIDTVVERHH
jgi:hypothetical protein